MILGKKSLNNLRFCDPWKKYSIHMFFFVMFFKNPHFFRSLKRYSLNNPRFCWYLKKIKRYLKNFAGNESPPYNKSPYILQLISFTHRCRVWNLTIFGGFVFVQQLFLFTTTTYASQTTASSSPSVCLAGSLYDLSSLLASSSSSLS